MKNSVKHWYNKLPEIGYEMKPYAKDGKTLLPNRGKGNYDADLYFGRGVKFNGVDQNITMPINDTINTILYFKNGSLIIDETLQTLTDYITDINSADIYQNFIFYKGIFEPHEKQYMETNPEKFLYHEKQTDGTFIAKSKILTQDKIDSVVAHFPMCETDGYVRNMIGYSETPFNTNTGLNGFSDTTEYHSVIAALTIESGSIRATDNANNSNTPRIVLNNKTKPNTSYRLKYSLTIDESVHNLTHFQVKHSADWNNNGGIAVVDGGLNQTTGELVFTTTSDTDRQYCGITVGYDGANDSNGAFWDLHYFELQELTETYPIENFTNAARDDAKNLTTGLQTCFLKRDVLGVPVGSSFNELTCIFDNAPIRLIMTDTELSTIGGGSWQFETILRIDNSTQRTYLFNTYDGSKGLALYTNIVTNWVYLYIYDGNSGVTNVHWEVTDTSLPNHFIFEYDGTTLYLFINGNLVSKATGGFVPNGWVLANIYNVGMKGDIRLFNIHTTPQDPAKLYADAVKKGLVPEQSQNA